MSKQLQFLIPYATVMQHVYATKRIYYKSKTKGNMPGRVTDGVVIWDTRQKCTEKHYDLRPYQRKNMWKLVPYSVTDYRFEGSPVIENRFFFLYLHSSPYDSIFLHAKRNGEPVIWTNELYKCYYTRGVEVGGAKRYGHGTKYTKILKNTPEEVVVEHQAETYPVTTTYRILKDKPWLEVRPVSMAHLQGIHGKVRMGLVPVEDGADYVVDSLRDPSGLYVPPPTGKMVICFFESVNHPFMWVLTFPSIEKAKPYFNCDSGPKGDTMWLEGGVPGSNTAPRSWPGCITATYARFGDGEDPVVIGVLTYWHNWHREDVDRPIRKGETYVSAWKPPYPGRWRLTARVAERRYDQGWNYDGVFKAEYFSRDVYDGNFAFTSPIEGHLDYVIMYMYDRIDETPANVVTPMDVYREAILSP